MTCFKPKANSALRDIVETQTAPIWALTVSVGISGVGRSDRLKGIISGGKYDTEI